MTTYSISGPDGKTYSIDGPPGATRDQVIEHIKAQIAQPSEPQQQSTTADIVKSAATGVGKGVAAVVGLPGDVKSLLDTGANKVRSYFDPAAKPVSTANGPLSAPTSEDVNRSIQSVTGAYHVPQTTAGKYAETIASFLPAAISPGGIAARVARVVLPGAASEAAGEATAGTGLEPYARIIGALAGGAATGIGEAALTAKTPTLGVPSVSDLKQAAHGQYAAADNAGLVVKKDSFNDMASDLGRELANQGMDATLHPKATAVFKNIANTDDNVTLKGIDILRQQAGDAAVSADPAERRLGRIIKDHIDDYVGNLSPSDVVMGDAKGASEAITGARDLWSRASKGEIIDNAIQKAGNSQSMFSQSGVENALRTRFRQLANNDRVMRRFSPDEQDAIRKVANGTPVGNALRFIGKFSPHGLLSSAITGGAGYELGGPIGAAAAMGVGEAGRIGATAITTKNARLASELARSGSQNSIARGLPGAVSKPAALQDNTAVPYAALLTALAAQQAQSN